MLVCLAVANVVIHECVLTMGMKMDGLRNRAQDMGEGFKQRMLT